MNLALVVGVSDAQTAHELLARPAAVHEQLLEVAAAEAQRRRLARRHRDDAVVLEGGHVAVALSTRLTEVPFAVRAQSARFCGDVVFPARHRSNVKVPESAQDPS